MKKEKQTKEITIIGLPEYSDWECHLFGAKGIDGIAWRPIKGKEPNFFWRFMQYIFFGNRWVKKPLSGEQQ